MKRKRLKRLPLVLLCLVGAQASWAADDSGYVASIGETKYQSLGEAIAAAPTDGTVTTITLLADVRGTSTAADVPDFTIPTSTAIVLDLNNHTVTGSGWGSVFMSEGDFTIEDNSTGKGGTITGGYAKGWNDATKMFYTKDNIGDQTDAMVYSTASVGGAVNVRAGKLTVNGGKFSGNYAYQGGAIYVVDAENYAKYSALEIPDIENPVSAVLNSCTVTGNISYSQAGGVGVYPYAHLTINDGVEISGNSTYNHGGGLVVARTSVVTMNGGTISGNKALDGGGVYATGFFTMAGGSIERNTSEYITTRESTTRPTMFGAGLCVGGLYDKFGKTVLKGGSIKDNLFMSSDDAELYYGAGVYATSGAAVSIYNDFVVGDNYIVESTTSTANDIQLRDAAHLMLEDDLTHDLCVGVAYGAGMLVDLNGHAYNGHVSTTAEKLEEIDGKLYGKPDVDAADAVCQVKLSESSESYAYLPSVEAGLALMPNAPDHTLTLLKDVSGLNPANVPYGNSIIDLGGHTLKASDATSEDQGMYLLTVLSQAENKSTLTLKNGTIDANKRVGCLNINPQCKVNVADVTFKNGNRVGSGGSVFVSTYVDAEFDNCKLTGNHSDGTGGAMYVGSYSTVKFNKCELTENTSASIGGAIRTNSNNEITLTDCILENNTAVNANGGAAYFGVNTVTINGGSYSNNHVTYEGELTANKTLVGGAIFITNNSNVSITNARIDGNTVSTVATSGDFNATATGGAIYVSSSVNNPSNLTITGGSVKDNVVKAVSQKSASVYGAGITAGGGSTLTINDCTISGNHYDESSSAPTVSGNGGGVSGNIVSITGGSVSGNTARSSGGAISAAQINLDGVAVANNKAVLASGGAIYGTGEITIKGGSLTGNTAKMSGGAIVTSSNATKLLIDGTSVTGNTSSYNGGAIYVATKEAEIKDAAFTGNKVVATDDDITANRSLYGGAVYVAGGTGRTVKLTNTTISGNTVSCETTKNFNASVYGGGVYMGSTAADPSTLTVEGGTISNNVIKAVTTSEANAYAYGAGVCAGGTALVTIEGTTIDGNVISDECSGKILTGYGAGVYHAGGTEVTYRDENGKLCSYDDMRAVCGSLSVSNTKITGNLNAGTYGGGIMMSSTAVAPSSLYLGKGTVISGNTCKANGAGVFTSVSANVTVDGAKIADNTIDGNSAWTSGAGIYVSAGGELKRLVAGVSTSFEPKRYVNSRFEMLDGEISGNSSTGEATLSGSAVRFSLYTDAVIKGGKVAGSMFKDASDCNVAVLGGKFDDEANTGTATATVKGRFKFSDFLALGAASSANADDDKAEYPYVVKLGDIVLKDKEPYTNTWDVDGVNVSYTRGIASKLGTIVLPFVPEANADVKFYEFDGSAPEEDAISLREVSAIEPGKAYFYMYQGDVADGTELTLAASDSKLHGNTVEPNIGGDWTMTGTYAVAEKSGAGEDFYYVNAQTGVIYKAEGKTRFQPYRAWATYSGATPLKAYRIKIDGVVTGIATVGSDGIDASIGKIYDLGGYEVQNPQRGKVYVVNGKKIMY